MNRKHLVVIGGGAAGFFCAVNAARMNPALQVTIIEKSSKLLSKVKVSGGGRCNVTHACFSISDIIKKYPRGGSFLKKAFHHFFTTDTVNWFKERGVILKTEADGRMFPVTDSSQTIIDCLMKEANKYGVEILMNREVKELAMGNLKCAMVNDELKIGNEQEAMEKKGFINSKRPWGIIFKDDKTIESDYVCIACGGYPKIIQFNWFKNATHSIEEPVPSLFTFNMPGNAITALMGVVVENAAVKIVGTKLLEQGPLLITHWGISGPVVLKLSAWGARQLAICSWQFAIVINWIPEYNENTLREKMRQLRFEIATKKIVNRNPFALPNRLWEYLLQLSSIAAELRWADLPAKEQNKLIKNLCVHEFEVKGKTTFKEEFVTAGGVELNEIDCNTMQSKKLPGLFFAGEVLNIDGVTGGFNFQNAWTTGWIAAKAISSLEGLEV